MNNVFESFTGSSNGKQFHTTLTSENIRLGFVRKVFGVLSFQLLTTLAFVLASLFTNFYKGLGMGWSILSLAIALISLIPLSCSNTLARKVPTNYALLAVFTLAESFLVGQYTKEFYPETVFAAIAMTAGITITLFIYAMTTKNDISYLGGLLFMLSLGSFILGLFCILVPSNFGNFCVSFFGAILSGIYIIYDVQIILGGKRFEISEEDYIRAAMFLYVDIIRLFIEVLELLGSKDEKKGKK